MLLVTFIEASEWSYGGQYPMRKPKEETMANQDAFIAAYVEVGSLRTACNAIGVSRSTVVTWNNKDTYGFRARYSQAKEIFREYLQDLAVGRVQDQKPNDNPVLLITLLNAHWPEKYRRDGQVASNGVKEMMVEWKKWVKDNSGRSSKDREITEAQEARRTAVDEVEKILSSRKNIDDAS
jgi:hypothetical protein